MKALKKIELADKLQKALDVSGTDQVTILEKELTSKFDPEKYDKDMQEAFDEEYYQDVDEEIPEDLSSVSEIEVPEEIKDEIVPMPVTTEDIWWACDGCFKPIKPGKYHFDCTEWPNFSFCEPCFERNESHAHVFKK